MRTVNELMVDRLSKNKALRVLHFDSALKALLDGETEAGLIMIRNLVNATGGFKEIADILETNTKSVMRMLSPKGNPTTKNLFAIISYLIDDSNAQIEVSKTKSRNRPSSRGPRNAARPASRAHRSVSKRMAA